MSDGLSPEDSMGYEKANKAVLQRSGCTAEGYREKFPRSKPHDNEAANQSAIRLFRSFDCWIEMDEQAKTFHAMRDLMVAEQRLNNCHSCLSLLRCERNCITVEQMADTADHFMEAQR